MNNLIHSESVEMYLKALAELGGGQEPVSIARVAERLNVTQVSANEMMERLGRDSLIEHTLYKGVTLTSTGRQLAYNVIRRQRLWERFLSDHLKLEWSRVHELACMLEHATPTDVTAALAAYLGNPTHCPHGNPIPSDTGDMPAKCGITLDQLQIGKTARILSIEEDNAEVLTYLFKRKVLPGQTVTLVEVAPLDGPLTLQLGEAAVVLGATIASQVWIEVLS
jgi:DtxR family Mn-dependent transcriptional regulator